MALTLLHTAELHRGAFDALRDRVAPGAELRHVVRPDWLERAKDGTPGDVAAEIAEMVGAAGGPVLCSCTTIGAAAEEAGAMRIDWPMMQAAARRGGAVMLAYAAESTLEPSRALLERAIRAEGGTGPVHLLALTEFWPLFQAGEHEAFEAAIAAAIRAAVPDIEGPGVVVLAQASMAGAAERLDDLGVPVLASPEQALRAALGAARPTA
ncbi:hypothetical protein BXY70_3154 [Roseovarius halotolerans]|uniref:Asp/Glu/Hydantoin racemase n=1 Tax=Roseovarius halotolerans TaxID=505353 RepID=A0A1X6ZTT6_9RHOB|nr:hypothetical protein [Roseovarius halotolerans]RKT27804.1 hypothetical protein BXY70_3154 [Roseovarius halotolerans]SLN61225.1 hypothetical protein ROH8110_03447 [Roseovarius halotolerans]